jgi:hypothetical protein
MSSNRHVRPMIENSIQITRGTIASTILWPNVNRGLDSVVTQLILAEREGSLRRVVIIHCTAASEAVPAAKRAYRT